jgi:hypothetical protein
LAAFEEWFDLQFCNIKNLIIFSTKITKLIEFTLKKHKYPKISRFTPKKRKENYSGFPI